MISRIVLRLHFPWALEDQLPSRGEGIPSRFNASAMDLHPRPSSTQLAKILWITAIRAGVDPSIRGTVHAHADDRIYLDGAYRGQVNGEIQDSYTNLSRYEELADPKYTDTGGIFDIMAVTVIETHLAAAA
jgi:hypothetical protein